jgi:hypothetical protein
MPLLSETGNNTTAFLSDEMIELLSPTANIIMERDYKRARSTLFAEEHDVNMALTAELVWENDVTSEGLDIFVNLKQ